MEMTESAAAEKLLDQDVIILHGEEEVALQLTLRQILAGVPQDGTADLNLSRLDGLTVSNDDLHNHLHLLPFGAEKRLAILDNAFAQAKTKEDQQEFIRLLDSLPPTTRLVLVIPDEWVRERKEWIWRVLKKQPWLTSWISEHQQTAIMLDFRLPSAREMNAWIKDEVTRQSGAIDDSANRELALFVGTETLLASREIEKLLIHTERKRPITVQDVRELCVPLEREDIFAMTDAIAEGNTRTALRLLDISLKNQPEPVILTMIVGQFRQLIVALEMAADGISYDQIGQEMKKPGFVVEKLVRQARRFGMPRLEEIFQQLADLDAQIKDNRMPADLALEMFVAQMAGR
jgi:DNA polymerase III subunit delta